MAKRANKDKGDLVEKIVARLQERPGVVVRHNVLLPTGPGESQTRQIDVLLEVPGEQGGSLVAIECKNEGRKTGVEGISAFIGTLYDVALPLNAGIYVSVSGYTKGAKSLAAKAGIRTLVLDGLTPDRVASAVREARQYAVYLELIVRGILTQAQWFRREDRKVIGSIHDLIWKRWVKGDPPSRLGEYELLLPLPTTWRYDLFGAPVSPEWPSAKVEVVANVISVGGERVAHALIDAADGSLERYREDVRFDSIVGKHPVTTVRSEGA